MDKVYIVYNKENNSEKKVCFKNHDDAKNLAEFKNLIYDTTSYCVKSFELNKSKEEYLLNNKKEFLELLKKNIDNIVQGFGIGECILNFKYADYYTNYPELKQMVEKGSLKNWLEANSKCCKVVPSDYGKIVKKYNEYNEKIRIYNSAIKFLTKTGKMSAELENEIKKDLKNKNDELSL